MNRHVLAARVAVISLAGAVGSAQSPRQAVQSVPAPRPLGPVVARSAQTWAGFSRLVVIGSSIFVQDAAARQLWILDTTLGRGRVVLDSTTGLAKENYYGTRGGDLLRFRADSLLFRASVQTGPTLWEPSPEGLVIGPTGKVARVVTMPTGAGIGEIRDVETTGWYTCQANLPLTWTPAVETGDSIMTRGRGDSATLLSVNFRTWDVDTIPVRLTTMPRTQIGVRYTTKSGARSAIEWPVLSIVDAWAAFHDGTIAIVRGVDYHIDMVDLRGNVTKGPKAPFEWRRVSDADRQRMMDSIAHADSVQQARNDSATANAPPRIAADGTVLPARLPFRAVMPHAPPDDWATFWPPLRSANNGPINGAVMIDEDDRIWVDERQPYGADAVTVYGIFDKTGKFLERVKVPAAMTVRGFGAGGVVYLTTTDGGRSTLLKARFK